LGRLDHTNEHVTCGWKDKNKGLGQFKKRNNIWLINKNQKLIEYKRKWKLLKKEILFNQLKKTKINSKKKKKTNTI